jgi:malate synthase
LSAAKSRAIFINTGFLDRTGDEIHSVMRAGPVMRKADCAEQLWLRAYEENNVAMGLAAALPGRGQIGKGMWAFPDKMKKMLATKALHLTAGASTSWVPSPTAATVHALHYHEVNVAAARCNLNHASLTERTEQMLTPPLLLDAKLSPTEIKEEVDANCQSILGYVSKWVNQGIGCSKVLNICGEGLMEDRATLRMSSQLLANWSLHGVVTPESIKDSLLRMAKVVDDQNEHARASGGFTPFGDKPDRSSVAFHAAHDLILNGVDQPNGYTEQTLTKWRQVVKADGPYLRELGV